MGRIIQDQVDELVYMMGVHKRAIMDKLEFNTEEDLKMVDQKYFKQLRSEIIEWKQINRG